MMRVVAGLCLVLWGAMAYGQTVRWRPDEVVKCHLESGDPYSQVFVRIERVGSLSRAATVSYATSGGTATPGVDYEPVAGTFQFRASPSGFEDALVPFLVFDDALREPNETVELTLSVSGGATLEGPRRAVVTIIDDESLEDETYESCEPGLVLEKTDNGHEWGDDPLIPYQITVTNLGDDRSAVVVRETVPASTRFVAAASTPGWSCPNGTGEGDPCSLAIGDLVHRATRTVTFAVEVLPDTPIGFEVFNQVRVNPFAEDCSRWGGIVCCLSALVGADCPCGDLFALRVGAPGSIAGLDPFVLFRLRDQVLRWTPGGRRAIELFYGYLDDLVVTSAARPQLLALAADWALAWQSAFVALIEGRGGEEMLTEEHTRTLLAYAEELHARAATPELADAIEQELERMQIESWVGLDMDQWLERIAVLSCESSAHALCLNQGRFRVEVEWRDFEGNRGRGFAESLTGDTGYFWFFDPDNVEVVLKVLDGTSLNDRFWVFYGALSNVEYRLTVTDTETGAVKTYDNPSGRFSSVGDTDAFAAARINRTATAGTPAPTGGRRDAGWLARGWTWLRDRLGPRSTSAASVELAPAGLQPVSAGGGCAAGDQQLCLNEGRFSVVVEWRDFAGGSGRGQAVAVTDDTGYFWFFGDANVELMLKVLDGRGVNGHFWVFYGALSNVEYTITVTDTLSGDSRTYSNPAGEFASVGDTSAF